MTVYLVRNFYCIDKCEKNMIRFPCIHPGCTKKEDIGCATKREFMRDTVPLDQLAPFCAKHWMPTTAPPVAEPEPLAAEPAPPAAEPEPLVAESAPPVAESAHPVAEPVPARAPPGGPAPPDADATAEPGELAANPAPLTKPNNEPAKFCGYCGHKRANVEHSFCSQCGKEF